MIDKARLEELQNSEKVHVHWLDESGNCLYDEMMQTIEALLKVREAAEKLATQFKDIQWDHYEKLVHKQDLESASMNWNSLQQGPLEFGPLLESLAASQEKGEGL